MRRTRPMVGVTMDLAEHANGVRLFSYASYARAIAQAGGLPLMLPPEPALAAEYAAGLDGFVLAGGDDPRTEEFGEATDPRATPLNPDRQAFETALLRALQAERPDAPVLGVCLGMQMMALCAGGRLDQHLPDSCATHAAHWERHHVVAPQRGAPDGLRLEGVVRSKHRQAVADAGRLLVAARAPDGIVEAVHDPARRFYLGVQWHPERTAEARVGSALFEALVRAARR